MRQTIAISGVLSQYDDTDVLRPIAFYARQMNSAEETTRSTTRSYSLSSIHLNTGDTFCKRILDPKKVIDLQALMVDMDLHLLVHSVVLQKVFVLESDGPLIIADFLAGEDNVWMDDIPDDVMDRCKRN
ncbi:hypothetical protein BASA81_013646 [Batrachochytrium salamandrivorans]|nr:hypothetical protein BASA81_013646 [Batrachochytrium salamandrivorans]